MAKSRAKLFQECKTRLIETKEELLNTFKSFDNILHEHIGGDEGDVASAIEEQDVAVTQREKILVELKEIEEALERIEDGNYGVCEETEELIEDKRLLTIPWTKLSLEGALIREREKKQRRAG